MAVGGRCGIRAIRGGTARRRFLAAAVVFMFAALGVGASDAPAARTACTGEIQGVTITGNLVAGPGCYLNGGVIVNGNVVVREGGSLDTFDSTINGNVKSHGGTSVAIDFYTTVHGNVEIVGSTEDAGVYRSTIVGNVLLKGTSGYFAANESNISGNLKVSKNTGDGSFYVDGSFRIDTVGGNVDISNNRGVILLTSNTITRTLNCHDNHPPVTPADGNTAGTAKGECAGVPSPAPSLAQRS